MRKIYAIVHIVILLFLSCTGQENNIQFPTNNIGLKEKENSNKELQEYKSLCLEKLFSAIAKSNQQSYSSKEFYYSITYSRNSKTRKIEIETEKWLNSRVLDYKGILKQDNVSFLLRGNFENDTSFTKVNGKHIVELKANADEDLPHTEEPVLQGFFLDCKSLPIYIEIYTANAISGFIMKQQGATIIIKKTE